MSDYSVLHFINGQSFTGQGKQTPLYQPATGAIGGYVEMADQEVINKAVAAAQSAFLLWSAVPLLKRVRILFKFKELLEQEIDELAKLITKEHGKTLADARGSIQRGIDVVEYACGVLHTLPGRFIEEAATGIDSYSIRQPLGVCVGITPFNFPAMVGLWMFPIAIVCGNTFIWKPSEKDPSVSVRMAEIAKKAGLPDGVLNVVQGDKVAVDCLLQHPDVKAVSFVGSTPVAESIYQKATQSGKRVQAFGGAKNHALVMPDADLEQTADALVGAAFGSAGERCMAISVVMVVGDEAANQLIEKMRPRIASLKIGNGIENNIDIGPLITKEHWERVKNYIDLGEKEGAALIIDGRDQKSGDTGFYMKPCVFDHVKSSMRIYREEIFGPVLSIVRVPDFETALKLINQHEYGNGTAIFTRDGYTARTFVNRVQVGMIGINAPIPVPIAYLSFGGWKRSFFGDLHMHGPEGIQFYTRLKNITARWLPDEEGMNLTMPIHR